MRDEIRLLCSGTATPASSLVPKGLALVDRLRGVDSDFGYQFWQVSDTQSIEVRISNGNATVKIFDADEQGSASCPPYQSGMTQLGVSIYRYNSITGAKINGSYCFLPSVAYATKKSIPTGWQIGEELGATNWLSDITYPIDSRIPARIPIPWGLVERNQTDGLKPGMYSGRMRHVVQVLLGSKTSVVYEFSFQKTHGIYKSNKGDWLIEISQENGVLAMPLPACKSSTPKENTLGYVPTGGGFPSGETLNSSIQSGKVKRLAGTDFLRAVYEKSTLSAITGWAFNYSGNVASVVVFDRKEIYYKGYLYTISFSGDSDGPSSVNLSLEESGEIVCQGANPATGYSKGSFKIPNEAGGPSMPVDFGPPVFSDYAPANCIAPVYVYYKSTGEKVLVRYQNATVSRQRPDDELRRNRIDGNPFGATQLADWVPGGSNIEYVEYAEGSAGEGSVQCNQQFYVVGHKPANETAFPARNTYKALCSSECYQFEPPHDWNYPSEGFFYGYLRAVKLIRIFSNQYLGMVSKVDTAIVIPTFDREAALSQHVITNYIGTEIVDFMTTTGYGASVLYSCPSAGLPSERDENGLPIGAVFTAVPGYRLSASDITSSSYGSLLDAQGDSVSGFGKGSVGGFGGGFGHTEVPSVFSLPYGLLYNNNHAFAGNIPYNVTTGRSGVYDRRVLKLLLTSSEEIELPKKFSPAPDEFHSSSISGPPDFDWFYFSPATYLLVRSWDGNLRYSPPQINSFTFETSDFGEYGSPKFDDNTSSINFIGDA